MSFRLRLPTRLSTQRLYSSTSSSLNIDALDKWIESNKSLEILDQISLNHLNDLYVTLPTRDGTRKPFSPPLDTHELCFGHHLVFFHPRNPELVLRPDGTDADFCPPEPFTRRMWAGGSMKWHDTLHIGQRMKAKSTVTSAMKKGFEKGTPMVFVNQLIEYRKPKITEPLIVEERSHVYLPPGHNKREPREVNGIPSTSDFSLTFTPSATTLFRFSALTFNGHRIHLDKDYAQNVEGYPERLVHGPLMALMLLETVNFHHKNLILRSFDYRARNPVFVDRPVMIHGVWLDKFSGELWTLDEDGVVGMTGSIVLTQPKS